ncbi:MAG: hypothetical protein GKC04_08785, partial [Methanomicrobiales archaeon]|nr:hypothetical protein [Methanomicrobiales archaeon]
TGILGERIPIPVSGVLVTNETGAIAFEEQGRTGITFPRGDYTITFAGTVRDSYLQAMYDRPYNVTVTIPPPYDVRNPLLGMISPGGTVTDGDGALTIRWEQVRGFECRFYDPFREQLLVIFGTFWLALCAVFLVPFLLVRRRNRD